MRPIYTSNSSRSESISDYPEFQNEPEDLRNGRQEHVIPREEDIPVEKIKVGVVGSLISKFETNFGSAATIKSTNLIRAKSLSSLSAKKSKTDVKRSQDDFLHNRKPIDDLKVEDKQIAVKDLLNKFEHLRETRNGYEKPETDASDLEKSIRTGVSEFNVSLRKWNQELQDLLQNPEDAEQAEHLVEYLNKELKKIANNSININKKAASVKPHIYFPWKIRTQQNSDSSPTENHANDTWKSNNTAVRVSDIKSNFENKAEENPRSFNERGENQEDKYLEYDSRRQNKPNDETEIQENQATPIEVQNSANPSVETEDDVFKSTRLLASYFNSLSLTQNSGYQGLKSTNEEPKEESQINGEEKKKEDSNIDDDNVYETNYAEIENDVNEFGSVDVKALAKEYEDVIEYNEKTDHNAFEEESADTVVAESATEELPSQPAEEAVKVEEWPSQTAESYDIEEKQPSVEEYKVYVEEDGEGKNRKNLVSEVKETPENTENVETSEIDNLEAQYSNNGQDIYDRSTEEELEEDTISVEEGEPDINQENPIADEIQIKEIPEVLVNENTENVEASENDNLEAQYFNDGQDIYDRNTEEEFEEDTMFVQEGEQGINQENPVADEIQVKEIPDTLANENTENVETSEIAQGQDEEDINQENQVNDEHYLDDGLHKTYGKDTDDDFEEQEYFNDDENGSVERRILNKNEFEDQQANNEGQNEYPDVAVEIPEPPVQRRRIDYRTEISEDDDEHDDHNQSKTNAYEEQYAEEEEDAEEEQQQEDEQSEEYLSPIARDTREFLTNERNVYPVYT